jgi:hypothetical protein
MAWCLIKYSLHNFNTSQIIVGVMKQWWGTQHARERWQMHVPFWLEKLKGRNHLEDPGV